MTEKKVSEINLQNLIDNNSPYHPSPTAWEDQVLYFLLLDRFSDAKENGYKDIDGGIVSGSTPIYTDKDNGNAVRTEADAAVWREAGGKWAGGTLKGLESKIGYLKRMGVSAIWISPIFKQVAFHETYHGYGIQNFLDVDSHFGSREDLKNLVQTAHKNGIYVVLDIILNHTGDVFAYSQGSPAWNNSTRYDVRGFKDANGNATIPFRTVDLNNTPAAWPNGAVWPAEFQNTASFRKQGQIKHTGWDSYPQYVEGDFYDLKKLNLYADGVDANDVDNFKPSEALLKLCEVYKFWIAYADIDGYRVDTVKHMGRGATRFFTTQIHEFAQSINKNNFYLIGEVAGGRNFAYETVELTGLNAGLGIDDTAGKLEHLVKGNCNAQEYFDLFRNAGELGKDSHTWFNNKIVTMFDDHDKIRQGGSKSRFSAFNDGNPNHPNKGLVLNALALNMTTLGIPCVYYGSEQAFDGEGDQDKYIREAMFGGAFGAFRSKNRHCFNEQYYVYHELAKILAIRRRKPPLRRGRQYLREISGDGTNFDYPRKGDTKMLSVVAWSRILDNDEMLAAINTDYDNTRAAWVTVDYNLHQEGQAFKCIYSTDANQIGTTTVAATKCGRKAACLSVPAHGFVIYEKAK